MAGGGGGVGIFLGEDVRWMVDRLCYVWVLLASLSSVGWLVGEWK